MNVDARKRFLQRLLAFDKQLAARGVAALSPFWRKTLTRFFQSDRRRLVLRVGRRGGKSLTMMKVALAWSLFGEWQVPPDDRPVVPLLSVDLGEAHARVRTLASFCTLLGIPHVKRSEEIELTERRVLMRVTTASISGVVGFTSIAIFCDEVSKWRDRESGVNPAREIVASLAPTMATQPLAFMVLSSSPFSTNDFHHKCFSAGDDASQMTAYAPTWVAHPALTEEQTKLEEPDERIWRREYLAEPSDEVSSIIGEAELQDCISRGVTKRAPEPEAQYVVLADVGLRNDRTGIVVAHRELREVGAVLCDVIVIDAVNLLKPSLGGLRRVTIDDVVKALAAMSREYNGAQVCSDLHYSDAIFPQLKQLGISCRELSMASSAQGPRIHKLIAHFSARTIDLVDDAELKKEILGAQLTHHTGGRVTLEARTGLHDDLLDPVLLGCDESTVVRLRPVERDIVIQRGPTMFDRETMTLTSDVKYFRRTSNGALVQGEPPYGSPAFIEMANDLKIKGQFTPNTQRWFQENPNGAPEQTRPMNINPRTAKRSSGWLFHKN